MKLSQICQRMFRRNFKHWLKSNRFIIYILLVDLKNYISPINWRGRLLVCLVARSNKIICLVYCMGNITTAATSRTRHAHNRFTVLLKYISSLDLLGKEDAFNLKFKFWIQMQIPNKYFLVWRQTRVRFVAVLYKEQALVLLCTVLCPLEW